MTTFATPEEEWRAFLSGTHPALSRRSPFRLVPSSPRCRLCSAPFAGPGGVVFRRFGYSPWEKNPNICRRCFSGIESQSKLCTSAFEDHEVRGAEVEISLLFADVRRSSDMARRMGTMEFTRLMQRFYAVAARVLIDNEAILDKFVGDEVVGFFLPFMAGPEHARRAIDVAEELLRSTGHGDVDGPWVPLGASVHTGTAFVGMISRGEGSEFTAFGDPLNVAAHLAGQAPAGEILVTDDAAAAANVPVETLERRSLSLKGHAVDAVVIPVRA